VPQDHWVHAMDTDREFFALRDFVRSGVIGKGGWIVMRKSAGSVLVIAGRMHVRNVGQPPAFEVANGKGESLGRRSVELSPAHQRQNDRTQCHAEDDITKRL